MLKKGEKTGGLGGVDKAFCKTCVLCKPTGNMKKNQGLEKCKTERKVRQTPNASWSFPLQVTMTQKMKYVNKIQMMNYSVQRKKQKTMYWFRKIPKNLSKNPIISCTAERLHRNLRFLVAWLMIIICMSPWPSTPEVTVWVDFTPCWWRRSLGDPHPLPPLPFPRPPHDLIDLPPGPDPVWPGMTLPLYQWPTPSITAIIITQTYHNDGRSDNTSFMVHLL